MISMSNHRNRVKRYDIGNDGFSLTEMVVVLVLLTILLTISGFGLAAYSRYSAEMQAEEYARTLYLAAQSSLTHAKASGQLEALRDEAEGLVESGLITQEADGTVILVNHAGIESNRLFQELTADALTDASILEGEIRIFMDLEQGLIKSVTYAIDEKAVGVYQ